MLVEGRLERFAAAGGSISVLVDRVSPVTAPDRPLVEIKDFSLLDEQVRRGLAEQRAAGAGAGPSGSRGSSEIDDFRAVAPPVMSFASGRRR
jgi:hypothetical protein